MARLDAFGTDPRLLDRLTIHLAETVNTVARAGGQATEKLAELVLHRERPKGMPYDLGYVARRTGKLGEPRNNHGGEPNSTARPARASEPLSVCKSYPWGARLRSTAPELARPIPVSRRAGPGALLWMNWPTASVREAARRISELQLPGGVRISVPEGSFNFSLASWPANGMKSPGLTRRSPKTPA